MSTKQKPKTRRLILGSVYLIESSDSQENGALKYCRWTKRGFVDLRGKPVLLSGNHGMRRLRFVEMPTEWQVVLLREYARKLERAGDQMAKWFPFSSLQRKRMVGEWTEARMVKP